MGRSIFSSYNYSAIGISNHLLSGYVMKIIKAYPPHFNALAKRFPIKGKPGILYAWGDTLYNPSGIKVTPWILAHEELHGRRQMAAGLKAWWFDYMTSVVFRYEEELLAHRAEWVAYQGGEPSKYLQAISERLASKLYGLEITPEQAKEAILA
jgi:hypothetical protein